MYTPKSTPALPPAFVIPRLLCDVSSPPTAAPPAHTEPRDRPQRQHGGPRGSRADLQACPCGRKEGKLLGFNGVHFPASPRVLPLHSQRTRDVCAPFSRQFGVFSLPGTQRPCRGRRGGGEETLPGLSVVPAPRKKAPCEGEESRRRRAQKNNELPARALCAATSCSSLRSRPQTPKIAPGPRRARKTTPSGSRGANSSGKTGGRRL